MTQPLQLAELRIEQLGLLREVLDVIGRIRQIHEPINSPDGLRQTIELVLQFAELLGVSAELTDRLRQILADENVFAIVLAMVRFLLGELGMESEDGKLRASFADGSTTLIEPQAFLSWLPIVIQIINLIRVIRGGA